MRPLDVPTPPDQGELRMAARNMGSSSANVQWPETSCDAADAATLSSGGGGGGATSAAAAAGSSSSSPPCNADVAVLVTGEFRGFNAPWRPRDHHWKGLEPAKVWSRLYDHVVTPNGPADLFIHSWTGETAPRMWRR